MNNSTVSATDIMSDQAFADLGTGRVGYVRPMRAGDITHLLPDDLDLQPNILLWVGLSADGLPIVVSDDKAEAEAGVLERNLVMAGVH